MKLRLLSTGVPGLDEVLGGGVPEYSFNLVAGAPGSGKTTLAHQFTFANASAERPALYFTVVGEPPLKMLRYQQQMGFFDATRVGSVIRFVDLSPEVLEGDLDGLLANLLQAVKDTSPAIVVVDSIRTVLRGRGAEGSAPLERQSFLQSLAVHLTSWQVTSLLVGEYGEHDLRDDPVSTVADGILRLSQARERNSIVRKLEVTKMRGVSSIPGLHTFRIDSSGVQVFPRATWDPGEPRRALTTRVSFGVPGLDELLGGGPHTGDATLVAGPSGTGKTTLGTHFISEGLAKGEPGVLAIFEEHPEDYLAKASELGIDLRSGVEQGKLRVVYLRPLDLSSEEILHKIREAVGEIGAKRLVIDSLNGLELALAPTFREDFRESLYRLIGRLTGLGVSVLLTIEVTESFQELKFSQHAVSFLAQNILFLRYVEIDGQLRKMLVAVKMRRSQHSKELHEFEITPSGMRITRTLTDYQGVLRGVATLRPRPERTRTPGLTARELATLDALLGVEEATGAELSRATGFSARETLRALDRLVALDYVIKVVVGGKTAYRPAERPLRGRQGLAR